MRRDELAGMIDQTLLDPTVGYRAARTWLERQRDAGFAALCVSPFLVPLAREVLLGSRTKVCTVAGFPLGYATMEAKAGEARRSVSMGAQEIDCVVNVAQLLEGDDEYVLADVGAVVHAVKTASHGGALVKVILETGYLDAGCHRAGRVARGAGGRGLRQDVHRVRSARRVASRMSARSVPRSAIELGIKAAGGIRDLATALAMIEAGATRIGTSSGLELLAEAEGGAR